MMENSIITKHRILSGVGVILLLLACNLAPVATPPVTPTVSAILFPTETPTPVVILPTDTAPAMDAPAASQCTAAPAGLIGWWPGNDDARDVVAGRDGRLNGGAGFAPGKVGQAFYLDGGGWVEVPRVEALEIRQGTIEFWMKPDPENAMDRCCQGLVSTEYFLVNIARGWSTVVGINFAINNGNLLKQTNAEKKSVFHVPAGEWSFLTATYDGQRLRLYVNGQEVQSLEHRGKMVPTYPESFLIIGSEDGRAHCDNCDGGHFFKGLIDEVSVYERALSAGEIGSIFAADESGKCPPSP